jgi:hypothetical protein
MRRLARITRGTLFLDGLDWKNENVRAEVRGSKSSQNLAIGECCKCHPSSSNADLQRIVRGQDIETLHDYCRC